MSEHHSISHVHAMEWIQSGTAGKLPAGLQEHIEVGGTRATVSAVLYRSWGIVLCHDGLITRHPIAHAAAAELDRIEAEMGALER